MGFIIHVYTFVLYILILLGLNRVILQSFSQNPSLEVKILSKPFNHIKMDFYGHLKSLYVDCYVMIKSCEVSIRIIKKEKKEENNI